MTTLDRLRQELHGTVYSRGDTVCVVVAPHPLRTERVTITMLAGLSVAEIADQAAVETHISDLASAVVAYIDGHVVERANWNRVRPKAGTTIVLRAVAEGPIFAGLGAIFSAISAATASVSAFIGGLGILGKVIGLGLAIGAQYLLNALFPVRQPQLADDANEQGKGAFSISGSRNSAAPWEAVPVVLGQHRVTPYYGALPYTESYNNDQYWRGLFVWCYGPAMISDIRIGETPLSSFQDVQIEHLWGNPGDGELPLFPGQVIEEPLSIDLEQSLGWVQRTTAPNITEISVDFAFPNGLYAVMKGNGAKNAYSATVTAQYRRVGDANWMNFNPHEITTYLRSLDPVRRTFRAVVAEGQYEVRIRRTSIDDGNVNSNDYEPFSKTVLTAIRGSRQTRPITFDKQLARTAVRIRASQQLNGGLDSLNGIVTASVGLGFNGTGWQAFLPTRNPANLIRHVLQGPFNARPVPDSQIDIAGLQEFWGYCNAQGFTYDAVITSPRSVYDMVAEIAAAGRGVPIFRDGRWSVIWDQADAPIVQQFTPRNSWGFEAKRDYIVQPHGFRCRFINRDKGFVEDERIVWADGYHSQNSTLYEGLEFPGVTDAHNIWRHARFQLAQLKLRPETITINADWENLVATRGDRVRVQHDVMLIGQVSGRIKEHRDGILHLDEVVTVEAGKSYTFRWRTHSMDNLSQTFTGLAAGEYRALPWTGPIPAPGELFSWGEAGIETAVYRVLSVEPNEDLTARITLVDDAPAISAADQGTIPPFQSNVSRPVDPFYVSPTDLLAAQESYQQGESWFVRVSLSWLARSGRVDHFEISMQNVDDGNWTLLGSTTVGNNSFDIGGLGQGSYRFRVRSIFTNGTFSGWATTETISTTSLLEPPANVTGFNIAVIGDISTLSWNAVPNAAHYEIRFVPEGTDPVWNSATPLVPQASGTSVQVPTMVGSYLIKAVRGNGVRSRVATAIRTNVAGILGLNVVEVLTEAGWPGTLDRLEIVAGDLRLLSKNVIGNWTSLADVVTMAEGVEGSGANVELEGFYTFNRQIDLGAVYTSRLTASIDAEGADLTNVIGNWSSLASVTLMDNSEPEDWGVELQVRTSDGGDAWSDWRPFVVGDVTARSFQFRLRLTGTAEMGADFSTISPLVHGLSVSIDMPDRVVAGDDILVPAAGRRISFNPPFMGLAGVSVSIQDGATGDRYAITGKDETGFNIRFFNSGNTAVARTFDYVAKGYGNLLN